MSETDCRVPVDKLRWICDPALFNFKTTEDIAGLEGNIRQDRALAAIEFGLGMSNNGFNIYLAGESGTGRTSTIRQMLKKFVKGTCPPSDWCYVNNFRMPDAPLAIALPAGMGRGFAADMRELLDYVRGNIPTALESKEYETNRVTIIEQFQEKNGEIFSDLEQEAGEKGFALQRTVSGLVIVPQKEGRNFTQEEYEALEKDEREKLDTVGRELTEKLNDALRQVRENEKALRDALALLDRELGLSAVGHHLNPLREKYQGFAKVQQYLEDVQEDLLLNLEDFKPQVAPPQIPGLKIPKQEPTFERYEVNVLVENNPDNGAPIVFESNPTYNNLFGRIENIMQMGGVATTNFTLIKPGALHRANGGYLILDAREVMINPFAWESLKRCIRNMEIKIEDVLEQYRFMTVVSLKPEPIPLNAKIIMIGSLWIYYLLYYLEPDYRKFFKVKADFDSQVNRTPAVMQDYALFVAAHCCKEGLLPFDPTGVAALLEHASRLVEDQERLSSQFMELSDLIRESSYWAKRDGAQIVDRSWVKRAIQEKTYRSNRIEERIHEYLARGVILCDTKGSVVGQINGLSVITMGDYTFGRPSRLTIRVSQGRAGMVNIEREVKLSGPIHDKGVLILTGYLAGKFGQEQPLSFSAHICFEQSYEGVEGDSASSAELYGLLSAFSGLPVRQGIAVTGSVNQHGQIQPIGGVNYKIEGFFAVCKAKGLTGEQGVMIPKINEHNLMLSDEVVQAVSDGMFHIWSVSEVEEGIEILTGVPAGKVGDDGRYPEGSVNFLVQKKLKTMLDNMRKLQLQDKEGKEGKDEPVKLLE
ncbi:AAA family ATPase [Geomonas subterranea]|uniref:endopeptidase La n=1 Tax=Geomonas subterranea TaxID=2847989 RepID=A0ABX8LBB4_9BACT|nr:ATP-binding protein [Geomonas subterranea]QXE89301.1 AAA family ATPase [Geomonas subterranea]QXM08586.1 AAA family ATPase [Geomonas subterranea]